MTRLPDGLVTFLFSDVEGSTRLLERDPEALGRALARHHELLAGAVDAHRGAVFETVGDAVYAAFAAPGDALAAAAAIQGAMAGEDWSPFDAFRVRLAVEQGAVERRGDHYFGAPLFRCARLQALANGGQTLCSADVAAAAGVLPPGLVLRPRGPHRLRDLAEPIVVLQLDVEGLPVEDRPLRGASATPTNLPAEMTSFVGRRREIAEISDALRAHRLVTLVGPGGTGKTRLAVEAARSLLAEFPAGVFLVELAAIAEADGVGSTVAATLDVIPWPDERPEDALARHLGAQPALLVLDNWEQVLPGVAFVGRLLAVASPSLRVLATSRISLGLRGERQVPVAPLDPDREARTLFHDRAEAAGARLGPTDDDAIARICRRLDGLPLAIELAASQARTRPMVLIRREVERNLASTEWPADVPERQRTLDRSIAWSVGLLTPDVRELFVRLGSLAGTFTAWAAAVVARTVDAPDLDAHLPEEAPRLGVEALDGLAALADASLLEPREDPLGEPRFVMLETIRSHAAGLLDDAPWCREIRTRHALWVRNLANRAERQLTEANAPAWMRTLDLARPDIAAALDHCLATGDGATACGLVGDLWIYWDLRGALSEETALAERAVDLPGSPDHVRAKALNTVGILTMLASEWVSAGPWFERAVDLYRRGGPTGDLADALGNLANSYGFGDPRTIDLLEEAVEMNRFAKTTYGLVNTLVNLAMNQAWAGDVAAAGRAADEAVARAGGHEVSKVSAIAHHAAAYVAYASGDTARLLSEARRSLEIFLDMQAEAVAWMPADLVAIGLVRAGRADDGAAVHGWGAGVRRRKRAAMDPGDLQIAASLEEEGAAAMGSDAWAVACARAESMDEAGVLRIIAAS